MSIAYDTDVVAWSEEQARLLRAKRLSDLDIEHIADEVEDLGRGEKRELASRLVVLLAHLLKWWAQPERRGASWRGTIREQRAEVADVLQDAPSPRALMSEPAWMERTWNCAHGRAMAETSRDDVPDSCPWTVDQILDADFFAE